MNRTTSVKCLLSGALILALTACAGTYHSYIDNLALAFTKTSDVSLTLNAVESATSDLVYVKNGEHAVAALALYKIEAGQHKWVSADNLMLIEEQGRIVRTLGFDNDLLAISNTVTDPIRRIDSIQKDTSWLRLADWKSGEYGYQVRSHFEVVHDQQLAYFGQTLPVTLVIESVDYETPANYLRFDGGWQNRFWFDTATGTLIKSEQRLAPFQEPLIITYISRVARLLPADYKPTNSGE